MYTCRSIQELKETITILHAWQKAKAQLNIKQLSLTTGMAQRNTTCCSSQQQLSLRDVAMPSKPKKEWE